MVPARRGVDSCPVTRERMIEINELAQTFFETRFGNSWGRDYLAERFGLDLAGHADFRPGQAPAGWTHLVTHLRRHGVTDDEMIAAGVATPSSKGRLIDRFRDRVMFPIVHQDQILGFVGRRHPDLDGDRPNTRGAARSTSTPPTTPLFHKGAQLFGVVARAPQANWTGDDRSSSKALWTRSPSPSPARAATSESPHSARP